MRQLPPSSIREIQILKLTNTAASRQTGEIALSEFQVGALAFAITSITSLPKVILHSLSYLWTLCHSASQPLSNPRMRLCGLIYYTSIMVFARILLVLAATVLFVLAQAGAILLDVDDTRS